MLCRIDPRSLLVMLPDLLLRLPNMGPGADCPVLLPLLELPLLLFDFLLLSPPFTLLLLFSSSESTISPGSGCPPGSTPSAAAP
jgi:hypothetical protein